MAEIINIELSDEMMKAASGGITHDELNKHGMKEYDAFGTVADKIDNRYLVLLSDGAEVIASFEQDHTVANGTRVALICLNGGWIMEEIRCF